MLSSSNKSPIFWFALLFIFPLAASLSADPASPSAAKEHNAQSSIRRRSTKIKSARKRRQRRRRGCATYASPQYKRMVRNWQKTPKIPAPKYHSGLRDLVLYSVNHGERIRVFIYQEDGTLSPKAVSAIQHLLRDKDTDEEHPIHPRLIKLLYRVADELQAKQINVISGYRASTNDQKESNHKLGRAVDFMVPGTPLGAAARRARSFGHVGVGFYPVSGFIHMDVRDGPSYFWIDRSGPGKPSCQQRMQAGTGAKSDRKWRPENDEPKPHKNKKGELLHTAPPPPQDTTSAAKDSNTDPTALRASQPYSRHFTIPFSGVPEHRDSVL